MRSQVTHSAPRRDAGTTCACGGWRSSSSCSCPPERVRATVRCLPRRTGISRRRRLATRTRRTAPRRATTRGETSSRRCLRPDPSARLVARLRADLLARGRAQVARAESLDRDAASAAWRRSHRFREPTRESARAVPMPVSRAVWQRPPRMSTGPSGSGSTSSAPDGMPGIRRIRSLRRPRRSRSARWSRASVSRRVPSGAAGGTTCARSASGRPTWPRTGSPAGSATARSATGCAGSE